MASVPVTYVMARPSTYNCHKYQAHRLDPSAVAGAAPYRRQKIRDRLLIIVTTSFATVFQKMEKKPRWCTSQPQAIDRLVDR